MDRLASVCEKVASRGSRLYKVKLVAEYLTTLSDDDLPRAVEILSGRPAVRVPVNGELFEERRHTSSALSVGGSALSAACMAATGWDKETIRLCRRESGDTGEAIGLLAARSSKNLPLPLARAEEIFTALYGARRAAEKIQILTSVFTQHGSLAIKYFVKAITGDLRIGLQEKMVEEAIAQSAGIPAAVIRGAQAQLGDLGRVALAARHGKLEAIEARLYQPIDFMLAKPVETAADLDDPEAYWIEDKFDGIRSQAHIGGGKVRIYSRGMDEVTPAFPEVAERLEGISTSVAMDGEVLAWKDSRALSFSLLQQRLARKKVAKDLIEKIPVVFMAYDLLLRDGVLLLDTPIEERRRMLAEIHASKPGAFLLSPVFEAGTVQEVELLFEKARQRKNEGLVLKRRGSVYEPGKRSGSWHKLKRPFATLDVVITAAEQGHGKRATVLSDYTFAVRGETELLNIGKAYTGLTDAEIREITPILRGLTVERHGRVLLVRPEIVLEIAFDGIQQSARHKSGYALRFPRIARWRKDKKPEDCDTIERVRQLYEASIA
jgi:DNA ligase-1